MQTTGSQNISAGFRENTAMAFATPLISYPWPDSEQLNQELKAESLATEKQSGGIVESNVGGGQSDMGIFLWDEPCIRTLQERVHKAAVECTRSIIVRRNVKFRARYRLDGWANVGLSHAAQSSQQPVVRRLSRHRRRARTRAAQERPARVARSAHRRQYGGYSRQPVRGALRNFDQGRSHGHVSELAGPSCPPVLRERREDLNCLQYPGDQFQVCR